MEKSVDFSVCLREIKRMGGLEFPPAFVEGWQELAKALQERAVSEEHAKRIVSRWIEHNTAVPKPSEIRYFAANVPADPLLDQPRLPAPCEICAPDGGLFVQTERGVKRCTCPRGQRLKLSDDQHQRAADERDIAYFGNNSLAAQKRAS